MFLPSLGDVVFSCGDRSRQDPLADGSYPPSNYTPTPPLERHPGRAEVVAVIGVGLLTPSPQAATSSTLVTKKAVDSGSPSPHTLRRRAAQHISNSTVRVLSLMMPHQSILSYRCLNRPAYPTLCRRRSYYPRLLASS